MEEKQLTLQIDHHFVTVPQGTTILDAARKIGVASPTTKNKEELIRQYLDISTGKAQPVAATRRGRPPKKKLENPGDAAYGAKEGAKTDAETAVAKPARPVEEEAKESPADHRGWDAEPSADLLYRNPVGLAIPFHRFSPICEK